MSSIIIDRPGGKKPPFFSKQNRLLGFWLMLIWISISLALVTFRHRLVETERNSLVVNISGVFIMLGPAYWFFWNHYNRETRDYSDMFKLLGGDVLHCGPTKLGWIAYGTNWIGSVTYPTTIQKLNGSDIDNIFWGDPGSFSQLNLNRNTSLNLNLKSFGSSPNFYWLIIYSEKDPVNSLVLTFRKKAEREVWLAIAKSLVSNTPIEVALTKSAPSKWQLACKGQFAMKAYSVASITGLFVALVIFASFRSEVKDPFTYAFMAILSLPSLSFVWTTGPSASQFTMRMWLLICGGDPGTLYASRPGLARGMLFIEQGNPGYEYVERIPISEIGHVKLEDWGHNFAERDLSKIFNKSAPSKCLVVRLYLDREKDSERELKLSRDDAVTWHKTLTELLSTK